MRDLSHQGRNARLRRLAAGTLLTAALSPATLHGEEARLVADLATGDFPRGSGTGPMVALSAAAGSPFLFAADDERHGRELWRSDGTEAGTQRVLDLCPGPCSSAPSRLTRIGSQVFFVADDGGFPQALFVTDGTAAGTRRVHELADAIGGLGYSMAVGNHFVFEMTTAAYGQELYRSDGTREGTRLIADSCAGNCSLDVFEPVSTSQGLFWHDRNRDEVMHLDLAAETIRVLDGICTDRPCSPQIGELDGKILVTTHGDDAGRLRRLIGLDGASEVLRSFENPAPLASFNFGPFVRSGAKLYFTGARFTDRRLYETDGTVAGSIQTPLAPFEDVFFQILAFGDTSFPVLPLYSSELRKFHVFKPGVGSVEVLANSMLPRGIGFSPATGAFFFRAPDGRLLWITPDQQVRAVSDFADIDAAVADLGGNRVALRVDRDGGLEPWPLHVLTGLWGSKIRDVNPDGEASSRPVPFAVRQGFLAVLDEQRMVGAPQPATNLLKLDDAAILPVPWAAGRFLTVAPGAEGLFLRETAAPYGLYFSDGQAAAAATGAVQPSIEPGRTAATSERLYFTTHLEGQDLWTSDGSAAGTREIQDPRPGWNPGCLFLCEPGEPIPVQVPIRILADDEHAYWSGHDEQFAYELWRVDPAGDAPLLLPIANTSFEPKPLIVWQGKLYFQQWQPDSEDPYQGAWQLWVNEDGASRHLADLTPRRPALYYDIAPSSLAAGLGDAAIFVIDDQEGRLWRSDGTAAGTGVVRDFGADAIVGELAATSSRVFLAVATPGEGAEPWVSDGTTPGTVPLGDLQPGPRGSHPAGFHPLADGRVVFAADDGTVGHEAWISDGTPAGTRLLLDLGPGASGPGQWASKGGRLLFAADDGQVGRELYMLEELPVTLQPCPADRLCLHGDRFDVQVAFAAPDGASGLGRRALASESSGVFTFFSPSNWELTVKVLDGCGLNSRFWVFAAATTDVQYDLKVIDRATGASKTYRNPAGTLAAAVTDTGAFATCGALPPLPRFGPPAEAPQVARVCPDDTSTLCLGADQRFRVRVKWETDDAESAGFPVPYGSADSGLFTFFSSDNWELMVKVLDGCALNGRHWLFAAGTTNVGWTLRLEDRQGLLPTQIYGNALGTASAAIADTQAMACTP